MTHPNAAAAYFRRLHAKLVDRPLSDRDDAWLSQMAMICDDVLANASLYQLQERTRTLLQLMDPRGD